MGDLVSEILKKYGTPAFIFAFVLAAAIWFLAHIAAAPGGEVTVLWGLVKYTKKDQTLVTSKHSSQEVKTSDEKTRPSESVQTDTSLTPLSLSITHNITAENISSALSKLRKERNLRELSVSESGKKINALPKGTYFFTLGLWLGDEGREYEEFLKDFKRYESYRLHTSEGYLEIHYPNNGFYNLILFVNEQSASKVSHLKGDKEHEIMAAFSPWGGNKTMVSLPIDRIIRSTGRTVQVDQNNIKYVLDLIIK